MSHAASPATRALYSSAVASLFLALCLFPFDVAHAATFSVTDTRDLPDNNLADPACRSSANTCTLRAAVEQSNASIALDSINVSAGIYELTRGPLSIVNSVSLRGVTEETTVIRRDTSGTGSPSEEGGIIRVGSRMPRIAVASVSLSRLTLTGGRGFLAENFPTEDTGGAIINNEGSTLALEHVTILNNSARQGGGIANLGTLIMRRSTVHGNLAEGGGINASGGGGLTNGQDDLEITSRTAIMRIEESTISHNTANKKGGGITNVGTLTIINSTISGNFVNGDSTFTPGGGGIFNSGRATLQSVTIANNLAQSNNRGEGGAGGGVLNTENALFSLTNTIVADNHALTGDDCVGVLNSQGFNLIFTAHECTILSPFRQIRFGPLNIIGELPHLAPLADNGGPTHTHALCTARGQPDFTCLGLSPAIDPIAQTRLGPLGNNSCPARDQRGFLRPPLTPIQFPPGVILVPIGPHASCDIGAFDAFAIAP